MATREMQLVSRIVHSGDLKLVLDWGIGEDDFVTPEGKALFLNILGYFSSPGTAGSVLGPEALINIFPQFVRCDDEGMTTDALCQETRKYRLSMDIANLSEQMREMNQVDPFAAASLAQSESMRLSHLGGGRGAEMDLGAALTAVTQTHDLKASGVDMSCAPWPWEPMQEATGGFEPTDYVVFYGRPKSMKSWVLCYLIAHLFNHGKRVIIYTKEMTPKQIFARIIACIAGIDYQALRLGKLLPEEREAVESARIYIEQMQLAQSLVCLSGKDARGGDTVPWLQAKIDKYRPDFIAIDGMYLMTDVHKAKKDHERVRNISRDLRQMNLDTGVPILATLQANRGASKHEEANLEDIAFSDAIGQDATIIARVINEKTSPTIQLVLGGSREFDLDGFRINGVPAYDFTYHGPLTEKDIANAKKQDGVDDSNIQAFARKRQPVTDSSAVKSVSKRIGKA